MRNLEWLATVSIDREREGREGVVSIRQAAEQKKWVGRAAVGLRRAE